MVLIIRKTDVLVEFFNIGIIYVYIYIHITRFITPEIDTRYIHVLFVIREEHGEAKTARND